MGGLHSRAIALLCRAVWWGGIALAGSTWVGDDVPKRRARHLDVQPDTAGSKESASETLVCSVEQLGPEGRARYGHAGSEEMCPEDEKSRGLLIYFLQTRATLYVRSLGLSAASSTPSAAVQCLTTTWADVGGRCERTRT